MRLLLAAALAAMAPAMAANGSGALWNARDPGPCVALEKSGPPTIAEAAALVRCKREIAYDSSDELWLLEDLKLQMGKGRRHQGDGEYMVTADADTSKLVYDLRGSWTAIVCRNPEAVAYTGGDAARNCSHSTVAAGKGICWQTTFGDWACDASGSNSSRTPGFPPPR